MRMLLAGLLATMLGVMPDMAEARRAEFSTPDRVLHWIYQYRRAPAPLRLPQAVHAMRDHGLLADAKKAGFFIGFIAGVLGANPLSAPRLIAKMPSLPAKQQAVIIKAIAFSGHPKWRALLARIKPRMPYRAPLIERYLSGEAQTLMYVPLASGAETIYALWGYYYATGHYQPVVRVIGALEWTEAKSASGFSFSRLISGWSRHEPSFEELTVGATAKWTLAAHAERNRDLLALYRAELPGRQGAVADGLADVIAAAERFEAESIREEQIVVIDKAKVERARKDMQPASAVTFGTVAIATGCVIATATGHPEIAVPCVISGAVFSGVTKLVRANK